MPGRCKFQESWLEKESYRDWLMRDVDDIHSARCRACCKYIKLQTMGEAAITSHAGGAGHKAAVRQLREAEQAFYLSQNTTSIIKSPTEDLSHLPCQSSFLSINEAGQVNGGMAQVKGTFWPQEERQKPRQSQREESKDPSLRSECLERSEVNHNKNSVSHNPELQDSASTTFITATGCPTKRPNRRGRPPSKPYPLPDLSPSPLDQQRALEQQRNMALLEWEGRMKVLSEEHELLAEKRRAARQKHKAYRLKQRYYRAKLRRLGAEVHTSSDSDPDGPAGGVSPGDRGIL